MKNNKIFKLAIIALFLASSVFYGCFKTITFSFSDSTTLTIPKTTPVGLPFNLPIPTVKTSATTSFDNQKIPPSAIKEATLSKLVLTITSPQDQTFSFLKSISIYIENSDGSNKQLIAYLDNIDSQAQSISLKTTDVNLIDYLKAGSYKLVTQVEVKQILGQDVDVKADLTFRVTAKIL